MNEQSTKKSFREKIKDTSSTILNNLKAPYNLKKDFESFKVRICYGKTDNNYEWVHIDREAKKLYFFNDSPITNGSILVDERLNLYSVVSSFLNKNQFLNNKITTICDYVVYKPNKTVCFSQTINASQQSQINVVAGDNAQLSIDVEMLMKNVQEMEINQLCDCVENDMDLEYKPIKIRKEFLSIIRDILNGNRVLDEFTNKIIDKVVEEAVGLLKVAINELVKRVKNQLKKQ